MLAPPWGASVTLYWIFWFLNFCGSDGDGAFSGGVIVYWQVAALDGPLTLLAGSPGPAYGLLFVLLVDACPATLVSGCCYSFAIFSSCVSFHI